MFDLIKLSRAFKLLIETKNIHEIFSHIQILGEILEKMNPKSIKETHEVYIAKSHLREIKRYGRKIIEENTELNERLKILEENKEK